MLEDFINERYLGFTLHMNEQYGHYAGSRSVNSGTGTSTKLILLPELTETIVLKPIFQSLSVQPRELRCSFHAINYEHVFRIEMVKEERRLCGKNNLGLHGGLLNEGGKNCHRVRVQS